MRRPLQVGALAGAETFGRGAAWLTLFALPWLLSADEYGIVVLLATFEGVATGFLLIGQDRAVIWRYAGREDPEADRTTVGTAMAVTVTACLLALIVVSLTSPLTGGRVLGVPLWPHVLVLGLAVILTNVNRVILAFARIARRIRDFVVNRMAVGALRLSLTLGFGAASGSSLAYPVGLAAGTFLGGFSLWRRILPRSWRRAGAGREARTLLRYGAPLSAHLLAMTSIRFIDRWVIGAFLGLAAVGSYGWFYMLGAAVAFPYAALSVYYEPEIYREEQQEGGERVAFREYLGATLMAAGTFGLIGSVAVLFAAELVPESVSGNPEIIRIVLIAHWLHPIYLVCNYLLSSRGRTAPIAMISVFAVLVATTANLTLVPVIGAIGGAWSTLLGAAALVLAALFVVRRVGIRVSLGRPLAVTSSLGALALAVPATWTLATASGGLALYGAALAGLHFQGGPGGRADAA